MGLLPSISVKHGPMKERKKSNLVHIDGTMVQPHRGNVNACDGARLGLKDSAGSAFIVIVPNKQIDGHGLGTEICYSSLKEVGTIVKLKNDGLRFAIAGRNSKEERLACIRTGLNNARSREGRLRQRRNTVLVKERKERYRESGCC